MASPTTVLPPDATVEVSPLDPRHYRALTLPNSLSVLLISDLQSERAAASLDIEVGSYSDPPTLPGLAHFLEHMLFLGTSKYPDEASFPSFLSANAGYSNAYTACENTNYHFELAATKSTSSPPNFHAALDRFAQFFTAPLFTPSATARELSAVHAEFQSNLQSDSWRRMQLSRTTANPAHPFSHFSIGSMETLRDIPCENAVDVRAELIKFHARYYSANLMKLCVVAPYPLDTLQEWVFELFSPIENRDVAYPWLAYRYLPPFLPEHKGRLFHVETIKDVRLLELSWVTPPCLQTYRSKPAHLLCNLLGDEGEGSILSLLKARDWGDDVSTSFVDERNFAVFDITVTMTRTGVEYVDDIIATIYDYIRMLRQTGIPEWLFKEEAVVAENAFRFREREGPYGLARGLSSSMHYFPPSEYLSGPRLFKEYAPDKVMELLDCFTPERGNIQIAGHFAAPKADMKERWFGTAYREERIEDSRLLRWRDGELCDKLSLPKPNEFIPTDFKILGQQLPRGTEDNEGPRQILRDDYMDIYHKLDRTFNRPKVSIAMKMASPLSNRSPWHMVMLDLFCELLEDALTEYSSITEKAGFDFSFSLCSEGIELFVLGYSHGIGKLLIDVVRKMTEFKADPIRFEMIRDASERSCSNFDKVAPTRHAVYRLYCLLFEPSWEVKDQLSCLQDGSVNVEAMHKFAQDILKRMFVTALVCGNVSEESAVEMMASVRKTLGFLPLLEAERPVSRVVRPPLGGNIFSRQRHPNLREINSAIEVYYQAEPLGNFSEDVKIELLADILENETYHELRTVQQLGYVVDEGLYYCDAVGGVYFRIQSAVASPDELLRRLDQFLVDVRKDVLQLMSASKFKEHVDALIASKAEPDKRLSARAVRFWGELRAGYLQFDRAQMEIDALRSLTVKDIVRLFDDYIAESGTKRRRIVSQVFGSLHPYADKDDLPGDAVDVRNPVAFRRQNVLHPSRGLHRADKMVHTHKAE